MWLNGTDCLVNEELRDQVHEETELEVKFEDSQIINSLASFTKMEEDDLLEKYSDFDKLIRISSWCLRFIKNLKLKKTKQDIISSKFLTAQEIHTTKIQLFKIVQSKFFSNELERISKGLNLPKASKIASLNPWIDNGKMLRVGGRLHFADIHFNTKHPILLPYKATISSLLVDWAHRKTLHGSVNLTLHFLRKTFWIINGKRLVKERLKKCMKCARFNAKAMNQLMGQLPKPRVEMSKPFFHTGVDYMGPIVLKMAKGRGTKTTKGYVAVFVCLATKAFHLESVSDLTADSFLAAFSRFIARRGNVKHMYSDNATNFTAASKHLKTTTMISDANKLINNISELEIEWHFIPPVAPHFGGLWEAGVKSIKTHLRKTIGETVLTVEELNTLLCRIEACLNSRPLAPINEDINDLNVLTPGHFLVGDALLAPTSDTGYLENNIHNRWKLL